MKILEFSSAYPHSLVICDIYALYMCYKPAVFLFIYTFISELVRDAAEVEETLWDRFGATAEWSPGPVRPINPATANGHAAKRKRADTPGKYYMI